MKLPITPASLSNRRSVAILFLLFLMAGTMYGQTNTVAGQYTVSGNEVLSLFGCTDRDDNTEINITSRQLTLTEGIAGNFTGSLTMSGLTKDGKSVGGTFDISGASTIGNPRNLTGTMTSPDPDLAILNGNFSAQWTRVGTRAVLSINISGYGTDGDGGCHYAAYIPTLNLEATANDSLTGTYTAGSIPISINSCTDPKDDEIVYIKEATVTLTESIPGNFSGTIAITAITDEGIRSATFDVSGTAPAGNPRTLTGTMTSGNSGLSILNGAFSATWKQDGEVTKLDVALGGVAGDPGDTCNYSVSIPLTGTSSNCSFEISITQDEFPFSGGPNFITLNAGTGCVWTIITDSPWITTTPSSGTGSSQVTISVGPNPGEQPRQGVVSVGGRSFLIRQAGAIPADVRQLVFVSLRDGNPEIYKMKADGTGQTRLTNATGSDLEPQWSPNGSKIAFRSQRDGNSELYVMNADGSNQTRLTNNSSIESQPTWSPNGDRIAFRCHRGNPVREEICIVNSNGANEVQISAGPGFKAQPKWSPDGTKIAFLSDASQSGNPDVYTMNTNGSNVLRLTTAAGIDSQPDWSPDGSKIAFTSFRDGNFELYTMDSDGSDQTRLTTFTTGDDAQPSYSPDGIKIAFTRGIEANFDFEAFVMNADGSNATRLTFTKGDDAQADWQTFSSVINNSTLFDFDGDGKADFSVFRPDSAEWFIKKPAGGFTQQQWGNAPDRIAPADYDGDGKTDIAVYRPSEGMWYVLGSLTGTVSSQQWGDANDVIVPGDYTGDGKADHAVWRPSDGYWYIRNIANGQTDAVQWGDSTDKPIPADYDGNGTFDLMIYRASEGNWFLRQAGGGYTVTQWGNATDKLVPADYNGDGSVDIAVWRPSDGNWYIKQPGGGFDAVQWGAQTDIVVPADYDGDGSTDIAVWRPSDGMWYIRQPGEGFTQTQWGSSGDIPTPSAFLR